MGILNMGQDDDENDHDHGNADNDDIYIMMDCVRVCL